MSDVILYSHNPCGFFLQASFLEKKIATCPNRAAERREDMKALLGSGRYSRILDLTGEEAAGKPAYFEVHCLVTFFVIYYLPG
eukprot:scaffold83960_cov28-Prasinocladus_malaysianus.AAC.1